MPPSSQCTCLNPALASLRAASAELAPVRQTSATGISRTLARTLFSASNWLICTLFAPAMWPFSKSALALTSTSSASSRLISAVRPAGSTALKPLVRRENSL